MFLGRMSSSNAHAVPESSPLKASERRFTNMSSGKSQSIGRISQIQSSQRRHRLSSNDESQRESLSIRRRTERENLNEQSHITAFQESIELLAAGESQDFDFDDKRAAVYLN